MPRKGSLILVVGFVTILSLISLEQFQRMTGAYTAIVHTEQVIEAAQALLTDLVEAESAHRGYLLTGDAFYLQPVDGAIDRSERELARLRQLTLDNPEQQRRLAQLAPLVHGRAALLRETTREYQQGQTEQIRQHLRQHHGIHLMEQVRTLVGAVTQDEYRLLALRSNISLGQSRAMKAVFMSGYGLSGLLLLLGFYRLSRATRGREQAEKEHQQSERSRRSAERLFGLMADNAEDYAMLLMDPEGRITNWNPGAERIKGYTAGEIVGQHFSRFYTAEDVAAGRPGRVLETARESGTYAEEGWRVRKDGSRFWASVTLTALRDETGQLQGFAKITRDMSARKEYEEALKQANANLEAKAAERAAVWRTTFDQGPVPIARFDLDGNWLEANPKWREMLGYSDEELLRLNSRDVSPREDMAEAGPRMRALIAGQLDSYTREKTFIRKDGGVVMTQITVAAVRDLERRPLYLVGAALDITERKQTEEALRASEAKFRATIEHAPMGITQIAPDGQVLFVNQALADMFGYSREELTRLRPDQVIHPDDLQEDVEGARRLLGGEITVYRRVKRHLRKDGSICWTDVSTTLLRDGDGQPQYFVALVEDITDRRQAEEALARSRQALAESEQRYRSLFDYNPDAVFSFDLEGRFLSANPSLTRLSGYTMDEMLGQNFLPLVAPSDRERALQHFALVASGEPQDFEINAVHKDGSEFPVDLTTVPMIVGGRITGVFCIAADITARKRAEAALQEALHENETIFGHSLDMICSINTEGQFLRVNPASAQILGYSPEELTGRFFIGLVHPDDRPASLEIAAKVMREGGAVNDFENRYVRKDGVAVHLKWTINWASADKTLICVARDITEAKRAELALLESERRYRATYENAPVGIADTDLGGRWLRVNQKLCDILGYSSDELRQMRFPDITHPDDLPGQLVFVERLLRREIDSYTIEKRYIRKDGALVWANFTGAMIRDAQARSSYFITVIDDISERKQMERALRDAEENLRMVVNGATEYAMIMLDPDGRITTWNTGAERILNHTESEAVGQSAEIFFTPEDVAAGVMRRELEHAAATGRAGNDRWLRRRDGSRFYASGLTMALHGESRKLRGFVVVFRDATAQRHVEEQHLYLANHDSLTGLPNRTYFNQRLHDALAYANRGGQHVALLLLDLDRFKTINDTLGHHVGDQLLKEVAMRLQSSIRETDTVARLGGDEFVVIQTQLTQPDAAGVLAQKLVEALAQPYWLDGQEIHSGTSVGVALYPNDAKDPVELMKTADLAMYKAKSHGRANYQFYTPDLKVEAQSRKSLESDLRRALKHGEFFLVYQPQIDLETWQISGVEALLRWRTSPEQQLSPDAFISLAEETGLIVPIGEWVLRTACEQGQAWQQAGLPNFHTAVNLSSRQFKDPKFRAMIERVLKDTGMNPSCLEMEITEGLLLENTPGNNSILSGLKDLGVKIAVDDFGTGFSALSYLKHFPIDVLKIDRSFTGHLPNNRHDAAIASSIIGLADKLDIRVVAEGVETVEQLAYLKAQHCTAAQGFYFSAPVVADELSRLLRDGTWSNLNPTGAQMH